MEKKLQLQEMETGTESCGTATRKSQGDRENLK